MKTTLRILKQMILEPGSEIGLQINALIGLVMALTLARLVVMGLGLLVENRAINKVRSRARKLDGTPTDGEDAAACCDSLLDKISKRRLVSERARALVELRYTSQSAVEALSRVDEDQAQEKLALPRFAATLPVLLGLVGTLFGLAYTVTKIQPLVSEVNDLKDLPELIHAMTSTLAGMKTAFTTSITGLLAGVILSLFATWVAKRYQAMLRNLESLCATKLIKLLSIPEDARGRALFTEAIKASSEQLKTATTSMEQWTDNLKEAINQAHNGQNLMLEVAGVFQDGVEGIGAFQEKYQADILAHHKNFEAALGDFRKGAESVVGAHGDLQDMIELVKSMHKSFVDTLDNIATDVRGSVANLKSFSDDIRQQNVQQVETELQGLLDAARQPFIDFFDALRMAFNEELSARLSAEGQRLPPGSQVAPGTIPTTTPARGPM